jgi:predicted GNAT family N-acyltransferase
MTQVVAMRSFAELAEKEKRSVHAPSNGSDVYAGQEFKAQLRIAGADREYSSLLPIYRLSPLGAEIDVGSILGKEEFAALGRGAEVDVKIHIAKQVCEFFGLLVSEVHGESNKQLFGVRWCESVRRQTVALERRSTPRWLCGEEFLPTGIAPNPARFNDFIYFKALDLSKDGMQICTSLRNKLLIPGMVLNASVSFPLVGQITVPLKIINARTRTVGGKDELVLGAKVLSKEKIVTETIGQYILQFGPQVTPQDLKQHGLAVKSVETSLEFGFVKTADDYREVLSLRKLAYSKVGKTSEDMSELAMGDLFDSKARIVVGRHQGKVVGSLRLMFHSPDETHEYDRFVKFPANFPKREDIVVCSRVCTHPNYRGFDLVYGLIRQLVLTALQSQRRYILGGSSEQLLPLYQKLGFEPTGLNFEHGDLNKVKEQVILGDVISILSGKTTSIDAWNYVYKDLSDYVSNYHDVEFDPLMNFRLMVYKGLGPVARLFRR